MAANALMMQVLQLTQIVVPGLAGLLVNRAGTAARFWLDAASFVFSAAVSCCRPARGTISTAKPGASSLAADLKFGARMIVSRRILALTIAAMAAGGFALSCWNALIPTYVRDSLHGSAGLFGLPGNARRRGGGNRQSAAGVAAKDIARTSHRRGLTRGGGRNSRAGSVGQHTRLRARGPLHRFRAALIVTPAQTVLQTETPVAVLGRISGAMIHPAPRADCRPAGCRHRGRLLGDRTTPDRHRRRSRCDSL